MTIRRRTATVAGVAALTGGAVTATVFALLPASAATFNDSAYGVTGTGASPFAARPAVSATDGATHQGSLATYTSSDGTITAKGMAVTAQANHALATVQSVSLPGSVTVTNAKAECTKGIGAGSASVAGSAQNVTVKQNVQVKNSNGSLTVIGAVVTINTVGGAAETVNVASATCDKSASTPPPSSAPPTTGPTTGPTTPPSGTPTAPVPTPTETHLPVTH